MFTPRLQAEAAQWIMRLPQGKAHAAGDHWIGFGCAMLDAQGQLGKWSQSWLDSELTGQRRDGALRMT